MSIAVMPDYVHRQEYREDMAELKAYFRSTLTETLAPLTAQVTKTNGRVSKLERWFWAACGGGAAVLWGIEKLIR